MSSGAVEYLVFPTTDNVWQFMGEKWAAISSGAISKRGYFVAALSGGKTPVGFYHHLSLIQKLPWNKTHIFFSDERLVPPDSPESNYAMIQKTLLSKVPVPPGNVHPVPAEEPSALVSAEKYEQELKSFFGLAEEKVPAFDLILLGVGEDGHTASLFPGTEALREHIRWAAPVILGTLLHDRITLTLPVINGAENIFVLVSGRRKRAVMRKLRQGYDRTLPAAMVNSEAGKVMFLMDKEAAG